MRTTDDHKATLPRRVRSVMLVALLVGQGLLAQPPAIEPSGLECFMVLVGKKATVDGSVLAAHNLELPGNEKPYVEILPRRPAAKGRELRAGRRVNVAWDAAVPGWMVLRIARSLSSNAAGINEHGVALAGGVNLMADRNPAARRADPMISSGVDGLSRNVALVQAKTAREAAARLGALYSTHGNAYACGVAYADANEIWYVESAGGSAWAAVRVPDDAYWPQGNSFRIDTINPADTANVMVSEGLLEFAKKHGLWKPEDGPFSFRRAFGDGVKHRVSERRVWVTMATFSPSLKPVPDADSHPPSARPDRPVSLADMFGVLRDRYECDHPGNPQGRLRQYPIGSKNVVHTDVVQLRGDMPVGIGAVLWTGLRSPPCTIYVPLYLGIEAVPPAYGPPHAGSADAAFAELTRSLHALPREEIDAALAELLAFERDLVRRQRSADERFRKLFADDPAKARRAMTQHASETSRKVLAHTRKVLSSSRSGKPVPDKSFDGRVPGKAWSMFTNPEEAGFSREGLDRAKAYWQSIPSAAFMVVRDGAVVAAWGDVERRLMLHSVRKSLMNGLIGAQVKAGTIDLGKTMAELGIDDVNPPLDDREKAATVLDLMRARSGVYHAAAAEPRKNEKPPRGAHAPGERWCYNNWDFNALGTILEQAVEGSVFEDFHRRFARPLAMQDFRVRDGHHQSELARSRHPAYVMRMSARDLARFGLLYLRGGRWNGEEILPRDWVKDSTRAHSPRAWGEAYGLLWWVMETDRFKEQGMFSGLGVGEQSLDVLPGKDLVIVHRVDTFARKQVTREQRLKLVGMILDAMTGDAATSPSLVPLSSVARSYERKALPKKRKRALCGPVQIPALRTKGEITLDGEDLVLKGSMGNFALIPTGPGTFVLEDAEFAFRVEAEGAGTTRRLALLR